VAIDSEAEDLLDELDGEAREARRRLLERLEADGVPTEELRRAVAEGRLALLPVERELAPPGRRYTFPEVAKEGDLDPQFLTALMRALGLPQPEHDEASYTDADVEAARTVARFREAGIPDDQLLETARVLGRAMAQVVSTSRGVLGRTLLEPGADEYEVATRWAAAAHNLNPLLEDILRYVLRAQQLAQLRQDVSDLTGLTAGATTTPISVAFADLVGFTRLGEQVPADELGTIAERLTAMATDVASPPVQLVKMIGDAAMFVSREPRLLLEAVLDLVEAADSEGESFPQIRAGIAAGDALPRAGDWFGRPVNLASRITDKARAGSVVATAELRDAVGDDGLAWSRLPGRRRFKGIDGEVELFRVRRAEPESQPGS
jgi:adenylate cyclase